MSVALVDFVSMGRGGVCTGWLSGMKAVMPCDDTSLPFLHFITKTVTRNMNKIVCAFSPLVHPELQCR